jgi:hypothetical protein
MDFETVETEAFGQWAPGLSDGVDRFLASHLAFYQVFASAEGKHLDLVAFLEVQFFCDIGRDSNRQTVAPFRNPHRYTLTDLYIHRQRPEKAARC